MSDVNSGGRDEASGSVVAADVIEQAMVVLEREREIFLTGKYQFLSDVIETKTRILQTLEVTLRNAVRTADVVIAVRRLLEASRRNEEIIRAAMQGLAQARRRLASIAKMRKGAVAYAEDGTLISSRDDALGGGKIA
ncbi:MAG: hypothetical protein ACFB03_05570 [Paracoccaceae bacterium]